MKRWNRWIRRTLIPGLFLGAVAFLGPSAQSVPQGNQVHEWVNTPAAQARSLAGDCAPDGICLELCIVSDTGEYPTGRFSCFEP